MAFCIRRDDVLQSYCWPTVWYTCWLSMSSSKTQVHLDLLHLDTDDIVPSVTQLKGSVKELNMFHNYARWRMVRSLLDYCVSVWVPYRKGDIEVLEKVQKKATKIIPEIRHLPYRPTERLKACKLPTLRFRQVRGDRDVHETFLAEAETGAFWPETEARPRRLSTCPRRDRDRGV